MSCPPPAAARSDQASMFAYFALSSMKVEKSLNNPKSYEKNEDLDFHVLLRDQVSLTNEIELSEEQWFDLNQKLEED